MDSRKIRELKLRQPRGSYKAQRLLASEEAEEVAEASKKEKCPELYLLYKYTTEALGYSVDIAKITRSKVSLSVEQFVAKQVRLFEYIKQIENYPNITNILESWPINPGITFAWLAGQNALDVAVKFAQMISTDVLVARNERAFQGVTSYDDLMVCPEPDPAFERWQNRTIKEIVTRSLPKPDIWPNMSDIHGDYGSLCYKLKDEFKKAEKQKVKPEDKVHFSSNKGDNSMEWDVFICHASEDKGDFVEPLANALTEAGIKVWYDRFELKLGDSLREKIDEGLSNSRYGIVVLSSHFFKKKWPKTELDALVSRQNEDGKKVILPIWHRIGIEEVKKFSPILASKLAAQSSDSLESIVTQIENVLNENSTPQKPAKVIYTPVGGISWPPPDSTRDEIAPLLTIEKELKAYKQRFEESNLETAFDILMEGEDLLTEVIGQERYYSLHRMYAYIVKALAQAGIAEQSGDIEKAEQDRKEALMFLEGLKRRIRGIRYRASKN